MLGTNRQTDRRTDKQTDSKILPTKRRKTVHTFYVGRHNLQAEWYFIWQGTGDMSPHHSPLCHCECIKIHNFKSKNPPPGEVVPFWLVSTTNTTLFVRDSLWDKRKGSIRQIFIFGFLVVHIEYEFIFALIKISNIPALLLSMSAVDWGQFEAVRPLMAGDVFGQLNREVSQITPHASRHASSCVPPNRCKVHS